MQISSLLFEAYTPQLPLGDWQIIISVNLRKGRIAVERWHSSEPEVMQSLPLDHKVRIRTGIRAFRRQMPILAANLDKLDLIGRSVAEAIEAVFGQLATIYGGSLGAVQFINGAQGDTGTDLTDFLLQKKEEVLSELLLAAYPSLNLHTRTH